MNRADRNRVQRALVTRPQGPGGDAPRGLAEWGGWLRQAGADVLGRVSLSELLDRLGRQVVRARRFRLYRGLGRRRAEALEPRVLLASPQIHVESQHNGEYYSIRIEHMGLTGFIGTGDNPNIPGTDDSLYYDDNGSQGKIWTVHLDDTGTTGNFDLRTNTKPLYFTGFDGDFTAIEFSDFNTYGQPLYVLQNHPQLRGIEDPPIVIEEPAFALGDSPGGMSLTSETNYRKLEDIGKNAIQITGTIDTTSADGSKRGNIGIFSNTTIDVTGGLIGADITLATWEVGAILSLQVSDDHAPRVTLDGATVDGVNVSITAAKNLRDFKRQMFGFDKIQSTVEVKNHSVITASGMLNLGADSEDIIGFADGDYNYLASQGIGLGLGALSAMLKAKGFTGNRVFLNDFEDTIPNWRSILNVIGFMDRHAHASVTISDSTLTATNDIDVSSIANAASSISSITSFLGWGGDNGQNPNNGQNRQNWFIAASFAIAQADATLTVTNSTVTSTQGKVNIGSSGSTTANATSRALAGFRKRPNNQQPPYQSNESTNTITVAFSVGNLTSVTTVDANSTISAAHQAAVVALGNSSVSPTATSRSYGDGTVGFSASLGIDDSTVQTNVAGTITAGLVQNVQQSTQVQVPASGDLADLDALPVVDSSSLKAGDWVQFLANANETIPQPVEGESSLKNGGSYYVVDTPQGPFGPSVQLAYGPALDIALPTDSQGQPVPISHTQYLGFSLNTAVDTALDPSTAGRPANLPAGSFYVPNHQFANGQKVTYLFDSSVNNAQPISQLTADGVYYVIRDSADLFRLALSLADVGTQTAIDIPTSSTLQGNTLGAIQFVSFDPNTQAADPDNDYQLKANGRITVNSNLTGVTTGTPVIYQTDYTVERLVAAPVTVAAQPIQSLEFDPSGQTELTLTVFDTVNTLWVFPSHGLATGDPLVYRRQSGSVPLQLVDDSNDPEGEPVAIPEGTTLYAIVIDADRIQLASSLADATAKRPVEHTLITESGEYTLTRGDGTAIEFDPLAQVVIPNIDLAGNRLRVPDAQDVVTGQRVTYFAGAGNIAIGGLQDGADYYVIRQGDYALQLAATWQEALEGTAIDLTGPGTTGDLSHTLQAWGVDPVHDWLVTPGHALETGQALEFQQGAGPAIGLVDGTTYYVIRVDDVRYRLAASLDAALAAGREMQTATPGAGVLDLVAFAVSPVPAAFGFNSSTIVQPFNPAITAPLVDLTANTLALGTGWTLGDRVVYGAGGGAPLGGLTDQTEYYVIPKADGRIQLAASLANAQAQVAIDLTSRGTLGLTGHYLRLVPEVELAEDEQPVLTFNPLLGPPVDEAGDRMNMPRHGYRDGQVVTYLAGDGAPVGGLVSGGTYVVRNAQADSFQLSATADGPVLDLQGGATGTRQGFEIPRTVLMGDPHLVGLTPGQTYYAVVDRQGNGTLQLRLAPTWLDAVNASLLHYDLSNLTPGTGHGTLTGTSGSLQSSSQSLIVGSQLNAKNGATSYPVLGGDPAVWEVLSYPEYTWNSFFKVGPGVGQWGKNSGRSLLGHAFGNRPQNAQGDGYVDRPGQGATVNRHSSMSAAVAMAFANHQVTTWIFPGAKLQTWGDMTLTATIAQSGTVVCWGGVTANQNTSLAVSGGLAVADYTNAAQVLIGLKGDDPSNAVAPAETDSVTLDAGGSMSITTDVSYDRLFGYKQAFEDLLDSLGSGWNEGVVGKFFGLANNAFGYLATVLSTAGLSNFLNVWVNSTNYGSVAGDDANRDVAGESLALSFAETFYKNTSEVTLDNVRINQDVRFANSEQSVDLDAVTSMTLISLAGMINFDLSLPKLLQFSFNGLLDNVDPLGNAAKNGGVGAAQILVYTKNQTIAQILGNSTVTTGTAGHLTVNAEETGKRTVLAEAGSKTRATGGQSGWAGVGSVALVLGDLQDGASNTLARIDQGVSVTGRPGAASPATGDLKVTATNTTNTLVGTGAIAGSKGAGATSVGASFGLVDLTRNTGAFLGKIDSSQFKTAFLPAYAQTTPSGQGALNVDSVTISATNLGWTWNVSLVGAVALGTSPVAPQQAVEQVVQIEDPQAENAQDQLLNQPGIEEDNVADQGPALLIFEPIRNLWNGAAEAAEFFAEVIPKKQIEVGVPGVQVPNRKTTTVGFAGDLALNAVSDTTVASFQPVDFSTVVITKTNTDGFSLDVQAQNSSRAVAAAGAGAFALQSSLPGGDAENGKVRSFALAGSVALNNVTQDTLAQIGLGAAPTTVSTVQSFGPVQVTAFAGGRRSDGVADENEYFFAVSGSLSASQSRGAGSLSGALSFASTVFGGTTEALLANVSLGGLAEGGAAGAVTVQATNNLKLSSDGGALAVAVAKGRDATGGGIGAMAAWNVYTAGVHALVQDASVTAASLTVTAEELSDLHAMALAGAIVADHPVLAVSGAVASNSVQRDVLALVSGTGTVTIQGAAPAISITATDDMSLYAWSTGVAAAIGTSGHFAASIGASVSWNRLQWSDGVNDQRGVVASLTGVTLDAADGHVTVEATSTPVVTAVAVPLGILAVKTDENPFSGFVPNPTIAAALAWNELGNLRELKDSSGNPTWNPSAQVKAEVAPASLSCHDLTVQAIYVPTVKASTIDIAFSVVGSHRSAVEVTVGFSYTLNHDFTEVQALLGSASSSSQVGMTVTGEVHVTAQTQALPDPQTSDPPKSASWSSHSVGVTVSLATANEGDVNVTGLGMFAYNVVEPAVTAEINNVHLTGATSVAVTALQQSELTATLRGVSVDVAISSAGFAWTIAPVVQVAINFDGGQTEARILQSIVTTTGATTVTATRNPTLIAKAGAVQIGISAASTVGVSGGLVWTTVANNPDRASTTKKTSKKEGWTDGGATAEVDSSIITASRIAVVATETPRYETDVLQVEADIAVGATFALAVSVGMVRSVNRLYDTVEATVSHSTLTATTGDIAVEATLARYQDPTTTEEEDFNIATDLRSYSFAVSLGQNVGAGAVVGCRSDITVQSTISGTVTDSTLQGATGVSVAALDDLSSRNHWKSVEVAVALGAGLSLTMAFPSLNTTIDNTVHSEIEAQDNSATVEATGGDVEVRAESRTRTVQEVKSVAVAVGFLAVTLSKPNLNTRWSSDVSANLTGGSSEDSLTVTAKKGEVRVHALYTGAGPSAIYSQVDDLGLAVVFGVSAGVSWNKIHATPHFRANVTGGVTATAGQLLSVTATTDGRLQADSTGWNLGLVLGWASTQTESTVSPTVQVTVGAPHQMQKTSLQAPRMELTAESLLDAAVETKVSAYGVIPTAKSTSTATLDPMIGVALEDGAQLVTNVGEGGPQRIVIRAVGGSNTNPPASTFHTSNVDVVLDTIDFQTFTWFNVNDRVKYDTGGQTPIGGLTDQTEYHVFPVNESTIQVGEQFDARLVAVSQDRLMFSEETAFKGPFPLSQWDPKNWDLVTYMVPAGTPVEGLELLDSNNQPRQYYVNKLSETSAALIDPNAIPAAPKAVDNSIVSNTTDSEGVTVTTFTIPDHGFHEGQIVSYVAPPGVVVGSDQVGTSTKLQVEENELGVQTESQPADNAIFIGDQIDQFQDGSLYRYDAGESEGVWFWRETDEQKQWKTVGARSNFWDSATQTAVNNAYTNWAAGSPRSTQNQGGTDLQIGVDGTWSNPAPNSTANWYVAEQPVFVWVKKDELKHQLDWDNLQKYGADHGMWLPSVTTLSELKDLTTRLGDPDNKQYKVFLGGTDKEQANTWKWDTSSLDPDNGKSFWSGLNDGFDTGSLSSPWHPSEPNDGSLKGKERLINHETRLVATYDPETGSVTWNDDKNGQDSLGKHTEYVLFERPRYVLKSKPSAHFADAAEDADSHGQWLATIGSDADNEAILNLLKAEQAKPENAGTTVSAWIGGQLQTGIVGLTNKNSYRVEVLSDQDYNNFGVTPLSPTISSTIVGNTSQNDYLSMQGPEANGKLTAVDGTTTQYYVLAKTDPSGTTTYSLRNDTKRTFAEAVQDATSQDGWVAFVQDNVNRDFNTARKDNDVWLNASDSAGEGTWRYASGMSGHAQSIRLLDPVSGEVMPITAPTGGAYTFTLTRAENGAIAGLKNFETYQVSKIDDNRFQLLAPAADGSLQPVVLPTPTDPTGGKGSYLGTLGIDLKKPGTGTHRLVLDLSTAPSSQTQTLQLVSAGSAPTSVGTGTASATGSALAVGAVSFAFLDTTATGQPHTHVTLADTVQLTADEGEIDIQAEAFGNGSSSARAKAYGIVAVANSNAQTTLGQTAQVTLLGHLQASTISIDAHIAGRGMNRSTAAAGGLAPLATANGNLDLDNSAQAKVQIGQADPANLTRLKSETDLAITSRFAGFMADVKTLSQSSGAFGNCRTNWNDGFTTAVHLGGDSPTALIIVENARLRVEDLHGRLSLESSIAGVDVDLTTKAYATGLLANLAKAEIDGGLKAQVALDENAWLRAATIALAAYETLQKWLAEAEIRRNGGRSDANATINNDGAVQVSAGSTAWLQTNHLQVDVRQFESRDPHGVWQPNSENATYFQTVSSSVHQKNKSDNLSATTTLDLSETIGWDPDATVEGMGQARLVIRPDGSVDSTQTLGSLDWTATSDTVTIHGVKSYDGTVDIDFGWTTNPWIEATTTKQGEDPLRGTVTLPPATPVTNMTITAGPVVTVINQSDRHLAIDSLDLLQATGTADVTLTNNGTDTNMTANLDGDFSRLTIDNEAAGRDVRLNGNLSAREVRLESQRNLDPAKFVTLSSREFLLDAGGTVGHGVTTPPTNPQILLQSWGGPDVASVKASAGQDLSLQVRFAPDSDGDVTQLQQFSAQQLDVRLLPWTSNSQEQTTNYQVQLEALSSTIPNRIVSLTGNMQPAADWSEATALSPTSVHLDVSGWVSNQPYPPILLVEATGNIDTGVVSSAGAPTSVSRVTSIFGDVTLSSPGDLTIGQLVSSPKTVTWAGAGALRSAQPGTPVIQANQLHLGGPGGLGSATRSLPTQVTWLTGTPDSASGALYVLNTDAGLGLHLDDVTVGTGNLQVITSGTLTVAGPVANTGGGNIAMAANGTGAGYQFVGGNWTYSQAQANAAAHQGTLASPVTPDQNRLFAELLAQAPNGPQAAWLAGDNLANSQLLSWTLPNGSQSAFFSLPTATPFDLAPPAVTRPSVSFWRSGAVVSGRYANWAANEPNNFGGQENHAVMKGDGTWNDKNRESPQFYVLFVPEQNSYTLISDRTRTFTEAVLDARSRGGYVARVADAAEQQAVKSAAQGNDVWLNQSDEGHEGDWQYADLPARFFYTNWAGSQPGYQPAGWSNWAVGEPNNWSGNEDNAVLNADGTWNDIAGTAKFPYVLYLRGTYTLMSTAVTFADAKADAQRKGGFVASVVTSDDQVKIKAAANGKTVWINNTDAAREGEWLAFDYVTQQYANFSNWAANEPNNFNGQENYAVMSAIGRWNDVAGTEQHGYVLYQPATGAYSYQAGPFTFAAALQDAAAKNGYMAHVTSGAEQTAVALAAGITPVGYSHWAVNEPNNANGNEDNAIMDTDGTWVDVPGSETHNYVLYKEGTYSYQHRLKKFTFAEAKADAQQQGGVVASVITSADQANVKNAANGNKVWINNTDAVNEGEWLAYDSSSKSYGFFSNWAAGEPNNSGGAEDNAVMTATGKWNDVKGTNTYGYVLYLPTTGAYSYQAGPFTFANAVADAQNKRGFVAGVTNVTEQAAVKAAANGNVVWLNATDAGLEGDWRRTKVVWLNATDDGTEGRWRVGTYGSTLNGAVMDYGGTWREEPVNQKHGYALYTPQDNKYTLQETPRTLAEARTHAASLGGVIARITTEAEQNRIRDLNGGVIWINLTDEASEGTWVAPGPTAASLPANAYRNWASQQPANALQSDNVVMEADGTWKTEWPSANYAYVLYTPADGKYTRIDGSFTFLQAQADAFHRGGYVAKVTTASEQTAVQTAAAGQTIWLNAWNDGQDYWRMLPDYPHATPGAFVQWAENFGWSHPRDWANGTPRGVQLQADGTWTLRGTTSTSGYLLQTSPGSIFVNSTIEATGGNGNINLVGQGDIRVGGAGGLDATIHSAGAGQIAIGPGTRYSDGQVHNGSGQAQLSMTPGSKITSDTGTIALLATGSIGLSQVKTGGSALIVADYNGVEGNLPDGTGAITVPAANAVNPIQVTAARAIFAAEGVVAGAGVGQVTTPIQIDVDTVAATTDKGDLALVNHGPLVLGSVDIQLTGLLAQVLKWKDVAPVTQLPGWLSQWFQHRQQTAPLIATANGHFVMGGAAILDQDNGGVATGSLSIETRNGNLTVRDNVPVINLDAGLLKLAAVSGTEDASLVIPDTTRLYTEGGTGLLVLHEGDAANPADLPVPEATCDLYHQLDTLGELTQGQQAWLKLAKCPDPAPLLRASFAPLGLLGSAPVGLLGGEAPAMLGATSVSEPVFFYSTDRATRDAATLEQAIAADSLELDTSRAGQQIVFVRVFSPDGEFNDYQRTVTVADQLPSDLVAIPSVAVAGQVETFTWQFADPGMTDQHRATIAWGDGTADTVIDIPVGERTFQATHRFTTVGLRPVQVTLRDIASGVDLIDITPRAISGITLVGGELRVLGSDLADTLQLTPAGRSVRLDIGWGGRPAVTQLFATRSVRSVRFDALAGDDVLRPAGNFNLPIVALGGEGNDHLEGGRRGDVLAGEGGDDVLVGWGGNDRLEGGLGNDRYLFPTNSQLGSDLVVEQPGAGTDFLDFSMTTRLGVVLNLGQTNRQRVNANLQLQLSHGGAFEGVMGGQLGDVLLGNSLPNLIFGGAGPDYLNGLGGADVVVGGPGYDTLRGEGAGALLIPDDIDLFPAGSGAFPLAGLTELLAVWSNTSETTSQRLLWLQTGFGPQQNWKLTNALLFVTELGANLLRG